MKTFLLFVFLIFSNPALSERLPNWVTDVPPCNSSECFYAGQGENAKEATANAKHQATCHQFGCDFQSIGSTEETLSSVDYNNYTRDQASARLKGFKQIKSATVAGTTYLLFSYSKKEIEAERKRRESENRKPQQVMGERNSRSGTLNLLTKDRENGNLVGDATVYIDGKEYGKSVMQIYLDEGTHDLKISHPCYDVKTDKILIRKGEEESPIIQLKPAEISIRFSSQDAPDAAVFLNGKKIGQLPGNFKVKLARKNVFTFKHPEFTDGMKVFGKADLSRNNDGKSFTVQMDEKEAYLKVSVSPATVRANIILDDNVIGRTGEEKQSIVIPRGPHTLRINAPRYYEESETFTAIGGKTISKHFDLKIDRRNDPALVSFVTKPVVADVYIDGMPVGQTNGEPIEISAGEHDFKLIAPRYLEKTGEFKVKAGETFSGSYTLKKNEQEWPGRISFKTKPVAATVYIDDMEFGPADGALRDILPGKHKYSLRYNGFTEETGDISVDSEEVRHMPVVNLKKNAGQASFSTRPVAADVYIDDKLTGKADGKLIDVNPGFHFYVLKAAGYFDQNGEFSIKTGETVRIPPVVLEKGIGSAKSNIQRINPHNSLIDKKHRFMVQKQKSEPLRLSDATTLEGIIERFYKWDFWGDYVQVAVSYNDSSVNIGSKTSVFYVRYRFDRQSYAKFFTNNIKPYLKNFVTESYDDKVHVYKTHIEVPDFKKWDGCNYKYAENSLGISQEIQDIIDQLKKDKKATWSSLLQKDLVLNVVLSNGTTVRKTNTVSSVIERGQFCPVAYGNYEVNLDKSSENIENVLISVEPASTAQKQQ